MTWDTDVLVISMSKVDCPGPYSILPMSDADFTLVAHSCWSNLSSSYAQRTTRDRDIPPGIRISRVTCPGSYSILKTVTDAVTWNKHKIRIPSITLIVDFCSLWNQWNVSSPSQRSVGVGRYYRRAVRQWHLATLWVWLSTHWTWVGSTIFTRGRVLHTISALKMLW